MGILILIIGIALLILLHEAGHFFAAKHYGVKVEEFGFGFPPRLFSVKKGDTTYSFNLLPLGGFVRLYGESEASLALAKQKGLEKEADPKRSFIHQSAWKRFIVISAGIAINFILGWLIISSVFMLGASESVLVAQVAQNSPADLAGIEAGDQLIGFQHTEDFISFINFNQGQELELTILNSGEERMVSLTPRTDPGVVAKEGAIGVALTQAGVEKLGFFSALKEGLITSIEIMAQIIRALWALLIGIFAAGSISENIVGPVGVFNLASNLSNLGLVYILQLVGLISLNLAVLNALPIPALDGGRLFFLLLEKLKGSKLNAHRELVANAVGFTLLLLLMVAITARDIVNLL